MAKNVYSERFLKVVSEMGITLYEVGKALDTVTNSQIYQIASGKSGASLSIISSFLEAYKNVNGNYILTGKGPMFLLDRDSDSIKKEADYDFKKAPQPKQEEAMPGEKAILKALEVILQENQSFKKELNNLTERIDHLTQNLKDEKIA